MSDPLEGNGVAYAATAALAQAQQRAADRAAACVRIDYKKLNAMVRRQKAALTRAINSGDKNRVILAARDAVREWNQPGVIWPDDWSRWQRAVDDVLDWNAHIDIQDLA